MLGDPCGEWLNRADVMTLLTRPTSNAAATREGTDADDAVLREAAQKAQRAIEDAAVERLARPVEGGSRDGE